MDPLSIGLITAGANIAREIVSNVFSSPKAEAPKAGEFDKALRASEVEQTSDNLTTFLKTHGVSTFDGASRLKEGLLEQLKQLMQNEGPQSMSNQRSALEKKIHQINDILSTHESKGMLGFADVVYSVQQKSPIA